MRFQFDCKKHQCPLGAAWAWQGKRHRGTEFPSSATQGPQENSVQDVWPPGLRPNVL